MWHKTDGKTSAEAPPPQAAAPMKSQAAPEPTAPSTVVSPAPVAVPPAPAPRATAIETLPVPSAAGPSRIHAGIKIHGEISGTSDLYIDGELQGKLRLGGASLVIGPNGKVQADIEAGGVTIEGSVQGNIKAGEGVHLGAGSRVQGSIVTPRIGIDDGARLRGKVEMVKAGSTASTATSSTPAARTAGAEALRPVAASAKAE